MPNLACFQSPKKVNLVAALVRGMRVEDALIQLQVTVKRAAQTVYRVISEIRVYKQITVGFRVSSLISSPGI